MKKVFCIIFFIAVCSTAFAQGKVSVLYDGEFDFATLKTFD